MAINLGLKVRKLMYHCSPQFFLVSVLISSCNLLVPFPVSVVGEVILIASPVVDVPPWFCTKCFSSVKNIKDAVPISSNVYIVRKCHITD
jgi:hypothetical protein